MTACADADAPRVRLATSLGDIVVELNPAKAPVTTENFLAYARDGFYDGLIFHRVIPNFMIQGGGFEEGMQQRTPRAPIKNEADNGLRNLRGTIAMARTNDPHSATAQFFINLKDNAFLDFKAQNAQGWGYCVFGKVVEGLDVVDKIAAGKTVRAGPHSDVPEKTVTIKKAAVTGES
ncbi:MAG: peptidylprolyl isomerase [Gammaproteobacteria bacterium]|nr:peptidylprolyl isomerase [Gammaproteobacteria bacterium]